MTSGLFIADFLDQSTRVRFVLRCDHDAYALSELELRFVPAGIVGGDGSLDPVRLEQADDQLGLQSGRHLGDDGIES